MKILLNYFSAAAIITMAAFGCNKPENKTENDFDNSVVVQGDRGQCKPNGPVPINGSLIGLWAKVDWRETNNIQYSSFLEFKNGTSGLEMAFQNYCTVKSSQRSVLASISSKVFDQVTSIAVMQGSQRTVNDTIAGIAVSCEVSAEAGTYRYQFDGLCLVIEGEYYLRKQ